MPKTYTREDIVDMRHDLNHVLTELNEFKERYHGARRKVMSEHIDRCVRIQNFLYAMENAPPPSAEDPRLMPLICAVLTGLAAGNQLNHYTNSGAQMAIKTARMVLMCLAEGV